MYRDERAALEARLEARRQLLEQDEARLRELSAEVERRRDELAGARWERVIAALVPVLGLVMLVVSVVGIEVLVSAPRRAKAIVMSARVREIQDRAASAREQLAAVEGERAKMRERLKEPPTYSAERTRLYAELRYLDASVTEDAWLIVGAVSCSRRDDDTRRRAREALPKETQQELDRLCEPWQEQP